MNLQEKIKSLVRDVPDFPKPGILFKDITPILTSPETCREIVRHICDALPGGQVEVVAGIESRGFLFGPAIAMQLGVPFVMIRKKGKLPYKKVSYQYDLEYGTEIIEMHIDAVVPGQRVLVHDDVLATGGTASAAIELLKLQGAEVSFISFLIELQALGGRIRLSRYSEKICTLVSC